MSALKIPLMALCISAKQFLHACPTAIIVQQEKGAWHTRPERDRFLFSLGYSFVYPLMSGTFGSIL
jgi:hypothetical protein